MEGICNEISTNELTAIVTYCTSSITVRIGPTDWQSLHQCNQNYYIIVVEQFVITDGILISNRLFAQLLPTHS